MRLSFNNVFNRYTVSTSDKLASFSFDLYKKIRIFLSKWIPLKEYEKYKFEHKRFPNDISTKMPNGYNLISRAEEDGYINLEYIDFYDYLPKEDISNFKKSLRKHVKRNKLNPFGIYISESRFDDIDDMGWFSDTMAFSNLLSVKLTRNNELVESCPQLSISLRNLSSSFLLVKYRFYVNNKFNKKLNTICRTEYEGYNQVSRQFNIPWYRPMRFGRSIRDGNSARSKNIYLLISALKWEAFREIRKSFKSYFWLDRMFPPAFETYSTNIRPSNKHDNRRFWNSVMFGNNVDYSIRYNLCVCWDYKNSHNEGMRLSAYYGGSFSQDDDLPEIVRHELADEYAVYLVAQTMNTVAKRDIALCNQKISSAMKTQRTHNLLKTRVYIEKKLYYSRRFVNEFSGDTIDGDGSEFRNEHYKNGSITSDGFMDMPAYVKFNGLCL